MHINGVIVGKYEDIILWREDLQERLYSKNVNGENVVLGAKVRVMLPIDIVFDKNIEKEVVADLKSCAAHFGTTFDVFSGEDKPHSFKTTVLHNVVSKFSSMFGLKPINAKDYKQIGPSQKWSNYPLHIMIVGKMDDPPRIKNGKDTGFDDV